MTAAKLVVNPPEGSGLVPQLVERHYQDLVRGKPGELVAAEVLLQPVGQKSRRTKDGWKTEVVYEVVRLEPARDSHEADTIAWNISRAYESRTSGSQQEMLPMNSPTEQRESLIEALFEWASEQNVSQTDLDARWTDYYGGREHAATETVRTGALLQLMEFARYVGAVSDPKQGGDDDQDDEDGFGAGDQEPEGDQPDEQPAAAAVPAPAFSGGKP